MIGVLAQAAPEAASGVSIGLSASVLAALGAWWAFKRKGRDWPGAIIFTCFGVVMAPTFVGDLSWELIEFASQGIEMVFEFFETALRDMG